MVLKVLPDDTISGVSAERFAREIQLAENVLLSHGAAVVTDFGIAKAISVARGDTDRPKGRKGPRDLPTGALTTPGTSIGTPAYMAPEQAVGDVVDARADLYAWGVVAYELLAGRHPFADRATAPALIAAHVGEQRRDAEHTEVVGGNERTADELRHAHTSEREATTGNGSDAREGVTPIANRCELTTREDLFGLTATSCEQLNDAIRFGEGKRPERDGIKCAEDGDRRTDPECQRCRGGRGETASASELPQRERDVLPQLLEILGTRPSPVALSSESLAFRADDDHVAEPSHGFGARGLWRHAVGDERLDHHVDVERELGADLVFDTTRLEQRSGAAWWRVHRAAHAGKRTGAIAEMNVSRSRVSLARWRRPFGVIA